MNGCISEEHVPGGIPIMLSYKVIEFPIDARIGPHEPPRLFRAESMFTGPSRLAVVKGQGYQYGVNLLGGVHGQRRMMKVFP